MTGIVLTQQALHASLAMMRRMGAEREDNNEAAAFFIDALNVLEALLDPQHQAPAPRRLPDLSIEAMHGTGIASRLAPVAEAWTWPADAGAAPTPAESQPDQHDTIAAADPPIAIPPLPTGPGSAADTARGLPAAEAPAPTTVPEPAPPPVLAVEEHPLPEADDAPPGDAPAAVIEPPRGSVLSRRLTAERAEIFGALWRDPALTLREITARLNALPGDEIPNAPALYLIAARLGLPKRTALIDIPPRPVRTTATLAEPPPAAPPRPEPPAIPPDAQAAIADQAVLTKQDRVREGLRTALQEKAKDMTFVCSGLASRHGMPLREVLRLLSEVRKETPA